jgi:hypothetical protein
MDAFVTRERPQRMPFLSARREGVPRETKVEVPVDLVIELDSRRVVPNATT